MEIKLGGETRLFKFGHIGLKSVEQHYGMSINRIFKEIEIDSIENLSVFTWACLKRYDKALSIEQVDEMIEQSLDDDEITYESLGKAITKAVEESKVMKGSKDTKRKN